MLGIPSVLFRDHETTQPNSKSILISRDGSIIITAITIFAQVFAARVSRSLLEKWGPAHFVQFEERKKRFISTQFALILLKIPMSLYWIPIFFLNGTEEWTLHHSQRLDELTGVFILIYLFDASSRAIDNELLIHHLISCIIALYIQYLRSSSATGAPASLFPFPSFSLESALVMF
ncbi:hypothetical protein C8J56DRAFT_1047201 [Mycena floridula]|nr:hypothetical protein C8J56DRAFT_1047201 [Mycena floridula]